MDHRRILFPMFSEPFLVHLGGLFTVFLPKMNLGGIKKDICLLKCFEWFLWVYKGVLMTKLNPSPYFMQI
jgi:hypothetical protein